MKNEVISSILKNRIICICRGVYGDDLLNLAEAVLKGGISLIEVTFDQSEPEVLSRTPEAISMLSNQFGKDITVGAGTVLNIEQLDVACDAGAKYIVSPNTDEDVIAHTKKRRLVSVPGAMTPSEILSADKLGADFVKVFPVSALGYDYIKDITTPINHLRLIAAGGICAENISAYSRLGFCGFAVSSMLCNKELILNNRFCDITENAHLLLNRLSEN